MQTLNYVKTMFRKLQFLRSIFLSIGILTSFALSAQDLEVNGSVTGVDGSGIPGVSITVQATQRGTITKADGGFDLTTAPSSVLVFSFVGYVSQVVNVNGRQKIDWN